MTPAELDRMRSIIDRMRSKIHVVKQEPITRPAIVKVCAKCGNREDIHKHHIIRRERGGSDESVNMALLCKQCHREWHNCVEAQIDYDTWCKYPRIAELLYLLEDMSCN